MDGAEMADGVRFEVNGAFLDLPVHSSFTLPNFQRLPLRQSATQAVPGSRADIRHAFYEMSHDEFPFGQ